MADTLKYQIESLEGICIVFDNEYSAASACEEISQWSQSLGAQAYLNIEIDSYQNQPIVHITANAVLKALTPSYSTLNVCRQLELDTHRQPNHLELEIFLCLARTPVAYRFPSIAEMHAAIRVRRFAVLAARQTELAFNPDGYERPAGCWTYEEGNGFLLKPGVDLVDALIETTQPGESCQQLYTFSCGRAAEYIMLLSIAQELKLNHPVMYERLQKQWQKRALVADDFNDAFLYEVGTIHQPLPMEFYVPGCRLWFRNPDSVSTRVEGFEGSWVIYLGAGEFCNLWERAKPFSLIDKCLEIYHWRDGVFYDVEGRPNMNEDIVRERVACTKESPFDTQRVIEQMMRYRDVRGVYLDGGCIDASRDVVRWICPESSDLALNN